MLNAGQDCQYEVNKTIFCVVVQEYMDGMEFLSSFELQCGTIQSVDRLRQHPSYERFMNKWSLPVYFQIRFVVCVIDLKGVHKSTECALNKLIQR